MVPTSITLPQKRLGLVSCFALLSQESASRRLVPMALMGLLQSLMLGMLAMGASAASKGADALIIEQDVTVHAYLHDVERESSSVNVAVLTTEDLDLMSYPDVARILDQLPGVYLSNLGGLGKASGLFIRGEDSFRTRLSIDGLELTDLSTPQAGPRLDFSLLADPGRVELIYGPQALLYGADAAGVIAIDSRRAPALQNASSSDRVRVAASAGQYNTTQGGLSYAKRSDGGDFSLGVVSLSSDGFNARNVGEADEDGTEQTAVNGRFTKSLGSTTDFYGSGLVVNGSNQYDDGFTGFPRNDFDQSGILLGLEERFDEGAISLEYARTTSRNKDSFINNSAALTKLDTKGHYELNEQTTVTGLVGFRGERLSDFLSASRDDRSQYHLAFEALHAITDRLDINAGVRFDSTDSAGSFFTHRAGVAFRPVRVDGLIIRADQSSGFRLPSQAEVAYNNGPFAGAQVPNELDVERSRSVSVGAEYERAFGKLGLTFFDSEIDKLIFFDNIGFAGYFQSGGVSTSRGVTLDFDVDLHEHFAILGSYTYNDTTLGDNAIFSGLGDEFERLRRPRDQYDLTLRATTADQRGTIDLRFYGRAHTEDYDFARGQFRSLDNHDLVDLEVFFRPKPGITTWLRVENLQDEFYEVVPTYNTAGRGAYVGFSLEL